MDVVIVGAGLAGLACAQRLHSAGANRLEVSLLEAADGPGGRVRSDVVDGFTLDRGFQLLNPAYPETQRVLDLGRLHLQSFPAEVSVATGSRVLTLADPTREPLRLPATLASVATGRFGTPKELASFARWALRAGRGDVHQFLSGPDAGWKAALEDQGVDGGLLQRVLEPFLAGVLGERSGETSHRFVELLVRSFVRGRPAVPWRGMQAISDQLAQGLDVRFGAKVTTVRPGAVQTEDGEHLARAVVVAADPVTAAGLVDGLPTPSMRPLTTFWHVAAQPPTRSRALRIDGDARGPIVNSVVISNTAEGYSPDGRALIASTVLGTTSAQDVERHLPILYPGADVSAWDLLRTDDLPQALTALPPPLDPQRPVDLGSGLFVAGDHRDTSSIQGALVSGRRAADAVLASLGRA